LQTFLIHSAFGVLGFLWGSPGKLCFLFGTCVVIFEFDAESLRIYSRDFFPRLDLHPCYSFGDCISRRRPVVLYTYEGLKSFVKKKKNEMVHPIVYQGAVAKTCSD